jgi:hypothetical protein
LLADCPDDSGRTPAGPRCSRSNFHRRYGKKVARPNDPGWCRLHARFFSEGRHSRKNPTSSADVPLRQTRLVFTPPVLFSWRARPYCRRKRRLVERTSWSAAEVLVGLQTSTVNADSVRLTGRYVVSRSTGSRPASRINLSRSCRLRCCAVCAPASW